VREAERFGMYDRTRGIVAEEIAIPIGSKVRIMAGPFIGLVAEIRHAAPRRRVQILFSMLGRKTVIQIEKCHLEKLPSA
jgi:transcription antitermination factor NusG